MFRLKNRFSNNSLKNLMACRVQSFAHEGSIIRAAGDMAVYIMSANAEIVFLRKAINGLLDNIYSDSVAPGVYKWGKRGKKECHILVVGNGKVAYRFGLQGNINYAPIDKMKDMMLESKAERIPAGYIPVYPGEESRVLVTT